MELKMKEKSGRMMTALYVRKLKSRVLCFRTPKLLVRLRVHKDFQVIKFHLCADNVNVSKKKKKRELSNISIEPEIPQLKTC